MHLLGEGRRKGKKAGPLISMLVTSLVQSWVDKKNGLLLGRGDPRPLCFLNIPCVCFPRGLENPGHRVQQERVKLKEVVSL